MKEDFNRGRSYELKREEVENVLLSLVRGVKTKQVLFVTNAIKDFEQQLYAKYGEKETRKCALFHALIGSSLGFTKDNKEFSFEEAKKQGIVDDFDFPDEEYSVSKFIKDLKQKIEENPDFAKEH